MGRTEAEAVETGSAAEPADALEVESAAEAASPKKRRRRAAPKRPPGLVRQPDARAVACAAETLGELGICRPEEIDLVAIAAHYGVFLRKRSLANEEGHLVRGRGLGIASVCESVWERGGEGFVLAHELGHFRMDGDRDDFARCTSQGSKKKRGAKRSSESAANDFASEVSMPRPMFEVWVSHDDVCLELVCEAGERFGMPPDAAAIRMLGLTRAPCAAVCTVDGRVEWWARTPAFDVIVPWGRRVDERTRAAAIHATGDAGDRARRYRAGMHATSIACEAWAGREMEGEIIEAAVPLGGGAVLTWLVSRRG